MPRQYKPAPKKKSDNPLGDLVVRRGVARPPTVERTKVLLSVDPRELAKIDELADAADMSRSEYMVASALTRHHETRVSAQVAKLRVEMKELAEQIKAEPAPGDPARAELQNTITKLLNYLSRRDVPDDVKDAMREVLYAAGVVW
jgi:hypothetical protein